MYSNKEDINSLHELHRQYRKYSKSSSVFNAVSNLHKIVGLNNLGHTTYRIKQFVLGIRKILRLTSRVNYITKIAMVELSRLQIIYNLNK